MANFALEHWSVTGAAGGFSPKTFFVTVSGHYASTSDLRALIQQIENSIEEYLGAPLLLTAQICTHFWLLNPQSIARNRSDGTSHRSDDLAAKCLTGIPRLRHIARYFPDGNDIVVFQPAVGQYTIDIVNARTTVSRLDVGIQFRAGP